MKTQALLLTLAFLATPAVLADDNAQEPEQTTPIKPPPECDFLVIQPDPLDPIDWRQGCYDNWEHWAQNPIQS